MNPIPVANPIPIDVVLEGGGVKGLCYLAAIKQIEKRFAISRLVGTSIGALTALLLAVGYSADELKSLMIVNGKLRISEFLSVANGFSQTDIESSQLYQLLQAIDLPMVPDRLESHIDKVILEELMKSKHFRMIFSLVEKGGLFSGDALLGFLEEALHQKGFAKEITFAELFRKTNKDLSLIAVDTGMSVGTSTSTGMGVGTGTSTGSGTAATSGNPRLTLNFRTAPQMPVVWAARASMSVPFCWQEVVWQREWGTYLGQDLTGHALVDGGVVSNFAIDLLFASSPEMGHPSGNEVVGFLLDEQLPCLESSTSNNPLLRRVDRLLDTVLGAHDAPYIERYNQLICRLPCGGCKTLDTKLTPEKQALLLKASAAATKQYLGKRFGS